MAQNTQAAAAEVKSEATENKVVVAKKVRGVVKWFSLARGYGFVHRNDIDEDVFIHHSAITASSNAGRMRHSVGHQEEIEFDVLQGTKGREAVNVTGPDGEPVKGRAPRGRRRGAGYRGGRARTSSSGRFRSASEGSDLRGRGGRQGGGGAYYRGGRQFIQYPRGGGYYDMPPMGYGYPPMKGPGPMGGYRRPPPPFVGYGGYYNGPPMQRGGYEYGPPPPQFLVRGGPRRGGGRGFRGGGRRGQRAPRSRGDSATGGESEGEGRQGKPRKPNYRNRRNKPKDVTNGQMAADQVAAAGGGQ